MVRVCECCGHPLPDDSLETKLDLTPLQRRLFRAIKRAGKAGIVRHDLVDLVYADHPDGGPETALNTICVTRWRVNHKLEPHGLFIKTTRTHPSHWILERI